MLNIPQFNIHVNVHSYIYTESKSNYMDYKKFINTTYEL